MTLDRAAAGDRAGVRERDAWTVTLWLADGTQATRITGIDGRDRALLTAARALVGADACLPRCARALVEGFDWRRRRPQSWWLGEAPARPPEPPAPRPPLTSPPAVKPRGRWPWSG